MFNRIGSFFFALLFLAVVSCAKKETTVKTESSAPPPVASAPDTAPSSPPVASPTAAAPVAPAVTGIATADGETPGVTATIMELKRSSGGTVSLKLVIANGSQQKLSTGYAFADPDNQIIDISSIGGVHLIDPVGKKKYFVARDSEKRCVCSQKIHDIDPGASVNVWAKFAAPPPDVQKVSVIVPHFSPMDDVVISGE
jgi:hypothetical protein